MKLRTATGVAPFAWLALAAGGIGAAQQAALPVYSPLKLEAGVIRSWGDEAMLGTMGAWEQAFRKYHPEISFEDKFLGTATSMAGIITGTSDLSLMGRPATANEIIGFEWVYGVKPLGIQVVNGGLAGEGKSPALAVFVSRDNPIREISVPQLASILGCPSDPRRPVKWAAAGAQGTWKNKPVRGYVYDDQTGTGAFLQQTIQGAKDCWNWDIVREFKDNIRKDGSAYPAGQQIVDELKRDPNGVAVSTLGYSNDAIKALPVSASGDAVPPTSEAITAGIYPLARAVYIYINRGKDKPVDPRVAEFLRFILSAEGQVAVERQGDYLPLNAAVAAQQRAKLE